MSKNIPSNSVASVAVADVFNDFVMFHTYKAYDVSEFENVSMWIEAINLFQNNTARTNVIIRGRDGKFISYKDVPALRDTVAALKPFPVVGETVGV